MGHVHFTYSCSSMAQHVVQIMQQLDCTYLISDVFTIGYQKNIAVNRECNLAAPFDETFDCTYYTALQVTSLNAQKLGNCCVGPAEPHQHQHYVSAARWQMRMFRADVRRLFFFFFFQTSCFCECPLQSQAQQALHNGCQTCLPGNTMNTFIRYFPLKTLP